MSTTLSKFDFVMLISHHRASPQERLFSVYTFSLWTQFCKYQGIASLLLRLISRCYSRLSLYKVLSDWRDKLFPSDFPAVAAKYADNMWTVCSCSAAECSVLQSAVIVSQIMLHAIWTIWTCLLFTVPHSGICHTLFVVMFLMFLWIRH